MSTSEKVAAAEARMNTAKEALLNYVERGTTIDQEQYQRLAARVKRAEAEFLKALADMGS